MMLKRRLWARKHRLTLLILSLLMSVFVFLIPNSTSLAHADDGFVVLRPRFDMVITEVEGENYVMIDRDPFAYIVNDRPINWTYRGSLTGGLAEEVERRAQMLDELVMIFENKCLPKLEETVGLKYWATLPVFDEDPPAIYIGLYRPTEEQMRAVVDMLGEEAEERGVIIKFYEAFAHRGLLQELERARELLRAVIKGGNVKLPVRSFNYRNAGGWFIVSIAYGEIADHVSRGLAVSATRTIREIIGYKVALLLEFHKDLRIDPLVLTGLPSLRAEGIIALIVMIFPVAMTILFLKQRRRGRTRSRRMRDHKASHVL